MVFIPKSGMTQHDSLKDFRTISLTSFIERLVDKYIKEVALVALVVTIRLSVEYLAFNDCAFSRRALIYLFFSVLSLLDTAERSAL